MALLDQAFREEIRKDISDYFNENEGSVKTVGTLWEAFKVVIRGCCIAKQAGVLKSIGQRLHTLEDQLKDNEKRFFNSGEGTHMASARELLSEYTEEANREVTFMGKCSTARWYGEGDRPGRTLADLLRPLSNAIIITELRNEGGDPIRGSQQILNHLTDFYSNLHTSTIPNAQEELHNYFDS